MRIWRAPAARSASLGRAVVRHHALGLDAEPLQPGQSPIWPGQSPLEEGGGALVVQARQDSRCWPSGMRHRGPRQVVAARVGAVGGARGNR